MKNLTIITLLIILTFCASCSQLKKTVEQVSDSAETKSTINIPFGMKNSASEPNISKETASIVTLPNNTDILYGVEKSKVTPEELGKKFSQFIETNKNLSTDAKAIYIVASATNDYAGLVKIFDIARKNKIETVKLVVSPNDKGYPTNVLEIMLPQQPKDNKPLKPNPLTLVAAMEKDGKFKLNNEDNTLGSLSARLAEVFRNREANGVFREGTNEIEKTVFVKASRSAKYAEVAKLIDALKAVYADPIGLQIDDLSD